MTGATVFGDVSGWRYRGALVPPGAVAVDGADDADITVTLGPPAAAPPETGPGHPVWRRAEDGRTLLSLPGIGRFHIEGGDRVGIEAAEGADPVTLGLLLGGPVLAALLRQRGLLPLDGAALGVEGGALLIVGASGLGKSSLAATLALRGWPVLADGVLAVAPTAPQARLLRGAPRLRLWKRSARALGLDLARCPQPRPGVDRFDTAWSGGAPGPWPIKGLAIVLNRAPSPRCEALSPGRAAACLARALWSRPAYDGDRAGAAALMADLAGLASLTPCWLLTPGETLDTLAATADVLNSRSRAAPLQTRTPAE
ncbi:Hpr(Ser) kinase/phosphatase [Rhodospirillum rubrum F11]|nr:HPr kinase [Rhodospirillum rubrum]AEO47348.1 Hpr(Ser) kinase/phosphatase [Rhodospirillum rubrum F11]QXG81317.1 serine kinase [Rhodospirillum rubrum]